MRVVRIIGILALGLAGALVAQTGGGAPGAGNAPKALRPGRRIFNPESVAARLMLATPQQRERALAKLPPERQTAIRKQLEWFDSLPKAQQDEQIRSEEHTSELQSLR